MLQDIPWPSAKNAAELGSFLFSGLDESGEYSLEQLIEAKKARVKREQLRWHPDKVTKCFLFNCVIFALESM